MTIELGPELEQFVQERIASGHYTSLSEIVREALKLLREEESARQGRLADLRREIRVGIDDLDAGRRLVFDEAARDGIKKRGAAMKSLKNVALLEVVEGQEP